MASLTTKMTIDTSQVQKDILQLQNQLDELGNTVKSLNENGMNIKLKMKVNSETFFQKMINKISRL